MTDFNIKSFIDTLRGNIDRYQYASMYWAPEVLISRADEYTATYFKEHLPKIKGFIASATESDIKAFMEFFTEVAWADQRRSFMSYIHWAAMNCDLKGEPVSLPLIRLFRERYEVDYIYRAERPAPAVAPAVPSCRECSKEACECVIAAATGLVASFSAQ